MLIPSKPLVALLASFVTWGEGGGALLPISRPPLIEVDPREATPLEGISEELLRVEDLDDEDEFVTFMTLIIVLLVVLFDVSNWFFKFVMAV
jgi:hypothetical protein